MPTGSGSTNCSAATEAHEATANEPLYGIVQGLVQADYPPTSIFDLTSARHRHEQGTSWTSRSRLTFENKLEHAFGGLCFFGGLMLQVTKNATRQCLLAVDSNALAWLEPSYLPFILGSVLG